MLGRRLLIGGSILVGAALVVASFVAPDASARAGDKPRVILLGFDGCDAGLAQRYLDAGALPNLQKLRERGCFKPLDTANPAQSPVSWAVLETASNPGKTNIGDFVRRKLDGKTPYPGLEGVQKKMVPAAEVQDHLKLSAGWRFAMSLADRSRWTLAISVVGLVTLLLVAFIGRKLIRWPLGAALAIGVLLGGASAYGARMFLGYLPARFPVPVPEMQGTTFWNVLDDAGVRFTGMQVPATFPAQGGEHTKIMSGLFTPDVAGGPGAWSIYTSDEWSTGRSTETGGTEYKIYADKDGTYRDHLYGPENFVRREAIDAEIAAASAQLAKTDLSESDRAAATERLENARAEQDAFSSASKTTVPFEITPDFDKKSAKIMVDGSTQTVAEGGWSDWYRVTFPISGPLKIWGIARVHVLECSRDAEKNERLKLFVPPISISPEKQPPVLPISWPTGFANDLAQEIGLFDTIGWACWTNPLKDQEIPEQAFMDSLDFVMKWRTKMLLSQIDKGDFEVLFHLESATDRAGHMLYRFIDEKHPSYDTKAKDGTFLRDHKVTAFGRTFALKDGILETYKEMDRIVGQVMERIDSGKLGKDVTLMVVSDHGFQPFRWGVNLNVWLYKQGYLVLDPAVQAQAGTVTKLIEGASGMLGYVDWTKTRAYSLGLGKIYINLKGREPTGIVEPNDFKPLKDEIIAKLEQFGDPMEYHDKARVVRKAYDSHEIYTGDYVEEPGDIILGFEQGYRASWQTTLGGFEADTANTDGVATNGLPWSGDHCGVDPTLVRGIFFCSKRLKADVQPSLLNVAPTILARFGLKGPPAWDGTPLELE